MTRLQARAYGGGAECPKLAEWSGADSILSRPRDVGIWTFTVLGHVFIGATDYRIVTAPLDVASRCPLATELLLSTDPAAPRPGVREWHACGE